MKIAFSPATALLVSVLLSGTVPVFTSVHGADQTGPAAASIPKPAPALSENGEIPAWVARLELARVLSYAKRYDEAVVEYRKLLAAKPDLLEARIEMANVLAWKGDLDAMERLLEGIPHQKLDPDSKLLLAEAWVAKKEYQRAESLFRDYLRQRPENQRARLKLAEMLSWQKKYDAALKEYRTILKAHPEDLQVRRKYAFVLIWRGNFDEAAQELKKTLKDEKP